MGVGDAYVCSSNARASNLKTDSTHAYTPYSHTEKKCVRNHRQ